MERRFTCVISAFVARLVFLRSRSVRGGGVVVELLCSDGLGNDGEVCQSENLGNWASA
jgi:hypothetical protein